MTLPAQDTLQTYGGQLANYASGVVDPTTDRDASAANQAYATTAMGSRMVPRTECAVMGSPSTPALAGWEAVWKQATVIPPVVSRVSTGRFRMTWPASVQDELGVTQAVNLTRAWGNVESPGYLTNALVTSPNVVDVYVTRISTAALNDADGLTIVVWAR